jgi:uncharacterized membrane protein YkoI
MRYLKNYYVLVLIFILITGCNTPTTTETSSNVLRVATNLPFEQMEFYDDGNMVGLDIDIIKAVGEKMGVEVEIKHYERDAMFEAVRNGEADVMISAIKITPENSQEFLFSSPYMQAGQVIIAKTIDTEIEDYKYYCPEPGAFVLDVNVLEDEREELISIEYDAEPFAPLEEVVVKEEPAEEVVEEPAQEITIEEAKEIALIEVPGEVNVVEIEKFSGKISYKVEIDADEGGEIDVFVDKETGEVLGTEK